MIIGKFTQQDDSYAGSIYGIGISVPFALFQPVQKTGNGPDFIVHGGSSEEDGTFELGAAWRKTSKKGRAYLSVKLDSPVLAQPINCALTEQQDGSHVLVWNRSDTKADEEHAA
jgi:uncharacterized protein (DUF736 family)